MNNTDKQIAVAEMLGWRKGHKDFPQEQRWKNDWFDTNEIRHTHLHFDSDANWLFDAIDWIEKQGMDVSIIGNECAIIDTKKAYAEENPFDIKPICFGEGLSKREAIFEALYQFSQYLKTKK